MDEINSKDGPEFHKLLQLDNHRIIQYSPRHSLEHVDKLPNNGFEVNWDGDFSEVKLRRSQSLPQLATDKIPHRMRSRLMSYGAPILALNRMRNISQRHFSAIDPEDENQERGNWSNPIEFFLSALGYAVGLGNIWRFPYLCYRNGGGAFLIPYLIMLSCCALPLLFMELSLGQYASQGPLSIWKLSPLFKGVGISMLMLSATVCIYYNLITGWAIYYMFISIREQLPWNCCEYDTWATPSCTSISITNTSCPKNLHFNSILCSEGSGNCTNSKPKYAADEYFHNEVLNLSTGLDDLGPLQWHLLLGLFMAWGLVFLALVRGIKSLSKTVYFTSTFPYFVLLLLLIRSAMEPGAVDGIKFYLTPEWGRLLEAGVWGDAAAQIFYSTGVCFGGAMTLASYNKFTNNLYRDAVIVALGNAATSIFSGLVVFSILGFMARKMNTTVAAVATSGPGLTFVAYPQAVTMLPVSPLWNFMFFLMLITLALSTMFPTTENIGTSIIDQFPALRPYKFFVTFVLCVSLFIPGIVLTTGGGMYILQLLDTYAVSYSILILGFLEVSIVAWNYGADNLLDHISSMIGRRPSFIWKILWKYVTPTLLMFTIVFLFISHKPVKYGSYIFPLWATALGWTMTCMMLLPIPLYACFCFSSYMREHKNSNWKDAIITLSSPSKDWGPALTVYNNKPANLVEDDVNQTKPNPA